MFSDECIYRESWAGNFYEPPEAWCSRGYDDMYDCDKCPYRYSKEDSLFLFSKEGICYIGQVSLFLYFLGLG